jgi:hypothetical protein
METPDNNELTKMINELDPETIAYGQCMSALSVFLSESYIAATPREIARSLARRWKEYRVITEEEIGEGVRHTINRCLEFGLLEHSLIPGKYTPSIYGWDVGKKYYSTVLEGKLKNNVVPL